MKSSKLKVIGAALVAAFILIAGVFYYASSKLQPEEIKKIAIAKISSIFPKSEVKIENVDIKFGFNFKVNLEKFKIDYSRDGVKTEMLAVDQLVVNVPIWSILTNSGTVEVRLDSPMLNYREFSDGNNWTLAMGGSPAANLESKTETKSDVKVEEAKSKTDETAVSVGFFGKSKLNVKFSDVKVKYTLKDNSNGEIKISRFLIKDMNLESPSAFELHSNAKFVMKDKSEVSFETLAIGQFNISELVKTGAINSNINIKVSKISKTGLDLKIPDITTDVEVALKKDGELSGKVMSTFEGQNKISANFKMAKQIEITDINVDIIMRDIAAIAGLDKSIDMSKAKLNAKGSLTYTADKKIMPNVSFSIAPGIGYSKDGVTATTTASGEMKNKLVAGKSKTEILEGSVTSSFTGEVDLASNFDFNNMKPFEIRVSAQSLKIPEKLIRSKLWDKKPKEEQEEKEEKGTNTESENSKETSVAVQNTNTKDPQLPPSNTVLEWNNINVGGEEFSGKGRIVTGGKNIAVDNLSFKFSKGTGKLTQTMVLGKKSSESKFNFEVANLNLNSFKAFLPPFIENFSGNFTGKVVGSAVMFNDPSKMPTYDVSVATTATNGEIKKLNIGEYINPLLANIPVVKDQVKDKQIKVDGNFETMALKGQFTNSKYTLSSFEFIGLDKKVQVTGSGEIYPIAGNNLSTVEANFIDGTGKISEVLQKNTGAKILPLKLVGPGFGLKPDYSFTVSKLAKGAMKAKGEEKIKEVVQKNLDKIVPEKAKETVKGLLNGLFKK